MAASAKVPKQKYDSDPNVLTARGRLAAALKQYKADDAADAARALVEAKKAVAIRHANELLAQVKTS